MAPDAVSLRILLAATRANQRYEGKGKNEIRDDAAEVMDTLMGRMLLRDAARANNQFSPRNWGTQSRGSWSPRASPRHHTSPRSPRGPRKRAEGHNLAQTPAGDSRPPGPRASLPADRAGVRR